MNAQSMIDQMAAHVRRLEDELREWQARSRAQQSAINELAPDAHRWRTLAPLLSHEGRSEGHAGYTLPEYLPGDSAEDAVDRLRRAQEGER